MHNECPVHLLALDVKWILYNDEFKTQAFSVNFVESHFSLQDVTVVNTKVDVKFSTSIYE
jgi:hypothetical protein